jgi:tetratricopeptide (TPR) repeat protein
MWSLRKLRKAARKNPRDAVAWYELGLAAFQQGELGEAEQALGVALDLVPPAPIGLAVGRIFRQLDRPAQALRAFRRAAEQDPESAEACTWLGLALIEVGERKEGLQQLARAAELMPDSAEPHRLLATQLLEAGQREQATVCLRKAITIDPRHQPSLALLGRCRREDGDLVEARAALGRAIELKPTDAHARVELGIVLARSGDRSAGFRCFREALEQGHGSSDLLVRIGMAIHEIGDLAAAIRYMRDAVRLDPGLALAHTQLGLMLLEEGSVGAATVALARAVELSPGSQMALYHLGLAYQRYGDLAEAERAFQEADRLGPDDEIQARLHEVRVARAAQRAANRADPTVPVAVRRPNAAMVGSLKAFALPDLLQLLRAARRTGVLYLSAGARTGEVVLCEGLIASASSPRASLAKILLSRKAITAEQLHELVSLQQEGSSQSLAALLLERGILDVEGLSQALEEQARAAVAEIVSWREGRFAFEPQRGEPGQEQLPTRRMEVDRVLLDVLG